MSGAEEKPRPMLRRLRGLLGRRPAETVRERVEALVEAQEVNREGELPALDAQERALLANVLKLRGKTAYDVMVPRADIIALGEDLAAEQAMELIRREGHSRYPVYRRQLDDIVGMVHIKDVIGAQASAPTTPLQALLRQPLFVVPTVPVLDLLLRMRQARMHMALVVDEYGGIDGLVTIEDLVETIVGDIADEHDEDAAAHIVDRADGLIDVDARATVEAFEERLGAVLTEEERAADIDTVGGLVFTLAGRVPARGELISHPSGLEFRVLEADPRRIRRLRVRRPGQARAAAE